MKITTTDATELRKLSALVFGGTGVGKTASILTLPQDCTFIAHTERGLLPLRGSKPPYKAAKFTTWTDVEDLYRAFDCPGDIADEEERKTITNTKVLVIDSLSAVADKCVQHILIYDRPTLWKSRSDGKTAVPTNAYGDLMGMEDWNLWRTRMRGLTNAFTQLPINVIMTCGQRWQMDKSGGGRDLVPNLTGKTAADIGDLFDLVLHMRPGILDGKQTRVWCTFNDGEVNAKDGSGAGLAQFEPADWSRLFAKILGPKTKGKK